jgi:hypothetical protein
MGTRPHGRCHLLTGPDQGSSLRAGSRVGVTFIGARRSDRHFATADVADTIVGAQRSQREPPPMDRTIARVVVVLGAVVATLAALSSAAGILLRGDLATVLFVTVRGEPVDVVMDGIYRYNAEAIVAEGVGWDIVTLLVVVPATFVMLAWLWGGSLRAALVMGGLLAYFTYQAFEYAMFWAYGPAYPLHLLLAALSISTLGLLLFGLDLGSLPDRIADRFPRRAVIGFCIVVVVVLAGLWLPQILGTLGGETSDELQGATTMVVPAFDLGLLVPLAIFTGIAVWKRLAIGVVLAVMILVKGIVMALAIVAMLLVEWQVTGEPALPPIVVFAVIAGLSLAIAVRAVRAVDDGEQRSPGTLAAGLPAQP